MIPHIPAQRQHKSSANKPFNQLVDYIEENKSQEQLKPLSSEFENIINYASAPVDKTTNEEKCIAIRTHGINDLSKAAIEMNAVSSRNTRCKDPAFHFILSWPEHEHPAPDAIFDAAEHAIKALGLADHQYVLAIHGNTDNTHCHIAVNRIHPETFRSHHIEWANKTLHMAARESEIKHGWTHDNGIYVVETSNDGKKSIILNKDLAQSVSEAQPYAHHENSNEKNLPPWHDPESLETWLKTDVSRALKKALPKLHDWNALHAWLAKHEIKLANTGGGMRLHATSPETGETLDLPASKGLRFLKRNELETRWGMFTTGASEPNPHVLSFPSDRTELDEVENNSRTPSIVPDLSHLTHKQLTKGINNVLRIAPDHGIPYPLGEHLLHAEPDRSLSPTQRRGSLYELPNSGLDGDGQSSEMLLQDALRLYLGDGQPRQDPNLRRTGTSTESSRRSLTRDNSMREERKDLRAAARADLRSRFSQYQRFVREGDTDHWQRTKAIQSERSLALKQIREETNTAKLEVRKNHIISPSVRLHTIVAIDVESTRRKLQVEADFQTKSQSLRAIRQPPLGWREWLHEQSDLGDQAALSALRGIVYQAQRDAKYNSNKEEDNDEDTLEAQERKYRQLMARLLEEERKEVAIRSANHNAMRPYEADALLARYVGIQWRVTGNGNVEYSDRDATHLFTDRGNRVTFDRARVSDEEIRLALVHAQQKFGKQITLTGEDPIFAARMARLADDMGMTVLNPELQSTITKHRNAKTLQITEAATKKSNKPAQQEPVSQEQDVIQPIILPEQTAQERLRAMVLSIDPRAEFIIPDTLDSNRIYTGPVVSTTDHVEGIDPIFAQHIGRGVYAIHPINAPELRNNATVEVKYHNKLPVITISQLKKDKERDS